ncbi:MAG: hypothetical protein K6C97_10555 [Treponema sp.]|nr:hypothetical protein [Treponema sp.]
MRPIPTTFNEHQISRTVIGGIPVTDAQTLNISVILLNSNGSHFKDHIFENLIKCNFQSIISIEHDPNNSTIDEMSKKYPMVRFLVPLEKASDGELINIGMAEVTSDYVLVLRDSLNIPSNIILQNLASSLTKSKTYCIVPRLVDKEKNSLPLAFEPSAERSHFTVEAAYAIKDGMKTLYPFDYIALYNRETFISLGGFDWTINTPYWQNLDLALRAWLWGEEIKFTSSLQFSYLDEPHIEDQTVNIDYLRYYLKNELPKIKMGEAYIKKSNFLIFLFRSSCGLLEARRQFKEASNWVKSNKYRFKMDLQTFIENWSK